LDRELRAVVPRVPVEHQRANASEFARNRNRRCR
jgi:hypothetical protein